MIQRIQTLWLLFGATCMGIMIFLQEFSTPFYSQGTDYAKWSKYVGYVIILSAVAFLLSAFWYKNRKAQMRIVRLNFVLMALVVALLAFYFSNLSSAINDSAFELMDVLLTPMFFMPLPALIFNWLGLRGIRKDEETIRSLNRIR
ncbi:MAG: DUF4293 domain-containing protein [Flavobacteriales bacterium]|nr:DUF4293 domain-containing protein [Flavobacteriales bacterium]